MVLELGAFGISTARPHGRNLVYLFLTEYYYHSILWITLSLALRLKLRA